MKVDPVWLRLAVVYESQGYQQKFWHKQLEVCGLLFLTMRKIEGDGSLVALGCIKNIVLHIKFEVSVRHLN